MQNNSLRAIKKVLKMVGYCLNHDKSDDGIIKSTKRFFRKIV